MSRINHVLNAFRLLLIVIFLLRHVFNAVGNLSSVVNAITLLLIHWV